MPLGLRSGEKFLLCIDNLTWGIALAHAHLFAFSLHRDGRDGRDELQKVAGRVKNYLQKEMDKPEFPIKLQMLDVRAIDYNPDRRLRRLELCVSLKVLTHARMTVMMMMAFVGILALFSSMRTGVMLVPCGSPVPGRGAKLRRVNDDRTKQLGLHI